MAMADAGGRDESLERPYAAVELKSALRPTIAPILQAFGHRHRVGHHKVPERLPGFEGALSLLRCTLVAPAGSRNRPWLKERHDESC